MTHQDDITVALAEFEHILRRTKHGRVICTVNVSSPSRLDDYHFGIDHETERDLMLTMTERPVCGHVDVWRTGRGR